MASPMLRAAIHDVLRRARRQATLEQVAAKVKILAGQSVSNELSIVRRK